MTSVVAIATGVLLSFAWPPIQDGLNSLSNFLLNKNLTLTTFIFGIIRTLINSIWFTSYFLFTVLV
ncbi:hypothetical protein ACV566_05140 [Staphylococcus aureus]